MIDGNPPSNHLAPTRTLTCKTKMAGLLARYGAETCSWALHQATEEQAEPPLAGRDPVFDDDALRTVWIFVESRKVILGLSANAICKRVSCERSYFDRDALPVVKKLTGETLRRRYQEAVKFLQTNSAPYRKLATCRADASRETATSPTERWWRKLLAEEIRRCAEMKPK